MASERKEYYIAGDDSLGGFQATTWHPQTFTTTSAYTVVSVKLLMARLGSPGNLTVSVRATSGGEPTGGDLCSVTIDPSVITTNQAGEWVEFTFDSSYALSDATLYAIVARTATGDNDNRIYWRADISSPSYTNGQSGLSVDSGSSWIMLSNIDKLFEVWGEIPLPGKPTNPSPTNETTDVTLDETPLSWDASDPAADTYEVYFREQGDDWTLVGEAQAGIEWAIDFGTLDYGITYEWRVDATNESGTTTGDTWNFGCIQYNPPLPTGITLDWGSSPPGQPTGTPTGENNIYTVKRLIAAANNAIWIGGI